MEEEEPLIARLPHKFTRNRKGYAGLIATIIMVLIILYFYFNVYQFTLNRNADLQDVTSRSMQLDADQTTEQVIISSANYSAAADQVTVDSEIDNLGPIPVQIVRLWVTDLTTGTIGNVSTGFVLQSDSSIIGSWTVSLPGTLSGETQFAMRIITGRGNVISPTSTQHQGLTGPQGPPGPPGESGNVTEITQTISKAMGDFVPDYHSFQWAQITPGSYRVGTWNYGWQIDASHAGMVAFRIDLIYYGNVSLILSQSTNILISNFPGSDFASEPEYPMLYISYYDSGAGIMRLYPGNEVAIHPSNGGTRVTLYFATSSLVPNGGPNGTPQGFETEDIEPTATLTLTLYSMPPSNYAQSFLLFGIEAFQPPSITISPTSGNVGRSVAVSGSNFAASSLTTISYDGVTVRTTTTNPSGQIPSGTFTVPASTIGTHRIVATDTSGNTAIASFTVTPSITLSRSSGPVGSVVTVTGQGFAASSQITLRFAGNVVATVPSTPQTDNLGSFSCSFTIPSSSSGPPAREVRATDAFNNFATSSFTVT